MNYKKLAAGFDSASSAQSCYRRIQRFMATSNFSMELVAKLIFKLFPHQDKVTLVMDRTNWQFGKKDINILMLGIGYKNMAFPLMFRMLNKKGNSNSRERISLLSQYIEWFGVNSIDCLLADREFIGREWLKFLNVHHIRYHIRIRNNFKILRPGKQTEIPAYYLFNFLKINQIYHYQKIVIMHGEHCYLSGVKTIRDGQVDMLIIVSFNKPQEAIDYYQKRWQIETLFKALKSSGFNLEDTHVTQLDRLERMILLTIIAFTWCYKIGDYIDQYITPIKIKTHGRRAVSLFKYGLDYLSRVLLTGRNIMDICIFHFLSCT